MTYGEQVICFERELNDRLNTCKEVEAVLSADVGLLTTMQLRELLYSKMAVETAERKYYAFKLFIYRNNLDLDMEIPESLIAEYDQLYHVTLHDKS